MENGGIPDSCITASSVYDNREVVQSRAGRLNNLANAWCSKPKQKGEWLKIDLARKMIVTKIATQGRPNHSRWVTSYKISFSQDNHTWEVYKEHGVEKVKGILYPECSTYCVSQQKTYLRMKLLLLDIILSSSLFLIVLFFLVQHLLFCAPVCSVCDHFLLQFYLHCLIHSHTYRHLSDPLSCRFFLETLTRTPLCLTYSRSRSVRVT